MTSQDLPVEAQPIGTIVACFEGDYSKNRESNYQRGSAFLDEAGSGSDLLFI